ncbi:MAG: lipocalin family protein [Candidatus Pseudobacter hemicellulosilyticus]|uniref:Lipocalin family protein n=1 Tax=Candidatus Pseudobacter hemicellulosilyticus TaxID=3121375 RepID=A0AAJ6BEA2_9BACT|nr:MAG: lipocalin family protein [Pseudobacter sp.]
MKKMKFLSAAFLLLAASFSACSPSKVASTEGGNVNIRGTWTVSNVDVEGVSKNGLRVTVFDDALYTCYVGSTWNLAPNGNGTYSVPASGQDCTGGERKIYWSMQNADGVRYFQFKNIGDNKAKNVTDGYRLEVRSLTASSMQLQSPVNFEGKTVYIVYSFTR